MRTAENRVLKNISTAMACVALVFGMFGITGCSSEGSSVSQGQSASAETIKAEPIEIYDLGFDQDAEGNVTYAFIAVNPNTDYMAHSIMFSIEGYDADGAMILGSAEEALELYPNLPTAFSGSTYVSDPLAEIDNFVVTPSMELVTWTDANEACAALPDMFEFSNIGNSRSSDGAALVRGVLLVNDAASLAQIEGVDPGDIKVDISVLLANTDGHIIAGGYANDVPMDAIQTVDDGSGEVKEIPTASFAVSIPNAPAFKEAVCFASPVH